MMNNELLKTRLLYYLRHGQENAARKVDLAKLCGANERAMRIAIRELIDEGYPICGSPHPPHGYFIAASQNEVMAELALLRNGYGMELLRRYKALKNASRSLLHPGQLPLGI